MVNSIHLERYKCIPYTVKTQNRCFYISAESDQAAIDSAKERSKKEAPHCDRVLIINDRDVEIADISID